ncbi:MAG: fimbria/pilus periplasmic chaperone, partial [Pseudomonas sp.]|nr:fimbria/pilus periplasmic chaperone [Pseudomonas sp.]
MQVMHSLYRGGRLFAGLMLWLFVSLVQAASLSVNPVIITLSSSDTIAAMTLTNNGSDDVVMQASVNAWSIRDNEEHYAATTALIVSPPVFQVAPG